MTRVAIVDVGTNSTRLLVADVENGAVAELERRTAITRLGEGVDATGRLTEQAMDRVAEAIAGFREVSERVGVELTVGIATSAVRDAANGQELRERLRERFGVDARTISGDEEARLTFLGATAGRPREGGGDTLVIDIGGGSTEYVVGLPGEGPGSSTSTEMGSVRHTERFLHDDPPGHDELEALARDVREILGAVEVGTPARAIAVAGTATSLAAIDEADNVHGHRMPLAACERIMAMLAALPIEERREVPGLHPDRAPTIVAGAVILVESLRHFGLDDVEVSEADLLHGTALTAAAGPQGA